MRSKTRIITSIVAISLSLALLSGCSRIIHSFLKEPIKTYTYTDDYPSLYADVLAEDIGDDLNMQVRTCDREHRGMDGFSILRGEYCEENISLERTVFESYVGEYW